MGDTSYSVRLMTKEDIPQVLDLWRETGLQEGTECLYTWLQVDKEAFHVAVTDSGDVIGICSGAIHHDDFAFIGLYAVRPLYQGKGIGKKLWNACMAHIGSRNAAVFAVSDKTELYRTKGGFPILETDWTALSNEAYDPVNYKLLSDVIPEGVDIQPFQESHLPALFEYDLALMGYKRELALELNCKENDSNTFVAFRDNKCVGFGTIKINCQGLGLIGPLYADDPVVAEVLLGKLIPSLPKAKGFAMMTISTNGSANQLAKKLNVPVDHECPLLYSKAKINVDTSKVFGHYNLNFSPY